MADLDLDAAPREEEGKFSAYNRNPFTRILFSFWRRGCFQGFKPQTVSNPKLHGKVRHFCRLCSQAKVTSHVQGFEGFRFHVCIGSLRFVYIWSVSGSVFCKWASYG